MPDVNLESQQRLEEARRAVLGPIEEGVRRAFRHAAEDKHLRDVKVEARKLGSPVLLFDAWSWFLWLEPFLNNKAFSLKAELFGFSERVFCAACERGIARSALRTALVRRYPATVIEDWRQNPRQRFASADETGRVVGTAGVGRTPLSLRVWSDGSPRPGDLIRAEVLVHAWPDPATYVPTREDIEKLCTKARESGDSQYGDD